MLRVTYPFDKEFVTTETSTVIQDVVNFVFKVIVHGYSRRGSRR
jgi:hypothetical protein